MNTERPPTRARGTVEFQGGPYDGLILVSAHYYKLPASIDVVFLESGQHMMRKLLIGDELGTPSGHYQLSPSDEGGDGRYHWQAAVGRSRRVGAVRKQ